MVGVMILDWNDSAILDAVQKPWTEANMLLGREFTRQITDPKWAWPNNPSPRGIVDTGALRDSYSPSAVSPTVYEHLWTVAYSLAVHEGYQTKTGFVGPPRPWTTKGLEDFNLPDVFARLAGRELGRVK